MRMTFVPLKITVQTSLVTRLLLELFKYYPDTKPTSSFPQPTMALLPIVSFRIAPKTAYISCHDVIGGIVCCHNNEPTKITEKKQAHRKKHTIGSADASKKHSTPRGIHPTPQRHIRTQKTVKSSLSLALLLSTALRSLSTTVLCTSIQQDNAAKSKT